MEEAIARYIEARIPGASSLTVSDLWRIPGGASRETWMLTASWRQGESDLSQDFVLRKDPPASLLDTDREVEYAFYSAFAGTAVPVPRMRWLEPDASVLGGPFFIMERIPAIEASRRVIMEPAYAQARPVLARRLFEILGDIATFEWRGTPIEHAAEAPTPGTAWKRELDHWERIIDENELSPQPIARAAIRWLRANPPPPAQRISVVHGDYRVGNVLYAPDGEIHGVVDWEMGHLGDPIEDLAWSFNETWGSVADDHTDGVFRIPDACRTWAESSGLAVDPAALRWWRIFCDVKCQGIWLTGTKSFHERRTNELILATISYYLINSQDEALLRSLGRGV